MRRKSQESQERERRLNELEQEREGPRMESNNRIGTKPVKQFAREHVHRNHRTVYSWIKSGRMPEGSVVDVMGHLEIDVDVFMRNGGIKPVR